MTQTPDRPPSEEALERQEQLALVELVDRVLDRGVVVKGDVLISVADVDLLYLGLEVVLTSVETARRSKSVPLWER